MLFEARHRFFESVVETFTPQTAPDWLSSRTTRSGSTMDGRWFWENHVLKLQVGKSIKTDFRLITRLE